MKLGEIIFDQGRVIYEGLRDFMDITEEMYEDGAAEDLLAEKAKEAGSGCDPMPEYLSLLAMGTLADKMIVDVVKEKIASNTPVLENTPKAVEALYVMEIKEAIEEDGHTLKVEHDHVHNITGDDLPVHVYVDGHLVSDGETEAAALYVAYDKVIQLGIEPSSEMEKEDTPLDTGFKLFS